MKRLFIILLSLVYNIIFSMDTRPDKQPCVALAFVSVKRSWESPRIHERPAKLLNTQIVEIATSHAPEEVKRIISSLQSPETIKEPIRSILTGEGVGKTTLAQAIAQKAQVNCKLIDTACMGTSYLFSEQENLIQAIAPLTGETNPWVVVLDDIDCLIHYTKVFDLRKAGDYGEKGATYHTGDEVVTYDPIESLDYYYGKKAYYVVSPARVLCDLLDILKANNKNNIAFIGTAREPEKIPEFVRRRFTLVDIPLPSESLRRSVLKYKLAEIPAEKFKGCDITAVANYFAHRTEGISQFGLDALADDLIMESYDGMIDNKTFHNVLTDIRKRLNLDQSWGDKTKRFLKNNKTLTTSIGLNVALLFYWLLSRRTSH